MKSKIKEKISDKDLYTALKNFSSAYKQSRDKAYTGFDFKELQSEMNSVKELSKEKVNELFSQFKDNAESAGAKVYQAKDAADACKYIADLAKQKDSEYLVKSKSMTSEEIKLNDYLESENLKPIETDLGEWILQLAGEHPSHMVMPAIHKTRGQVSELFENHTGETVSREDIGEMVKVARNNLREFYFKAGVGITGANVAVAETGTIGIVTNEGNARLSSTIPPVHVVLVGYEKLVPTFREGLKVVRMLPKSATGQIITTYTTWIKGQNPSIKNETGNKEVHYVFLDSGRLDYLDHPLLKEALKCIRCGSCANICPAYEMVGGHVFGHVYIGAIGLIMTAMFHGDDNAKDILKLCIGCKACSANCPAGIDLQRIIAELNVMMGDKYGLGLPRKFFYKNIMANDAAFRKAMKAASAFSSPLTSKDGEYIKTIPLAGREINFRMLPSIKGDTFTDSHSKNTPPAPKGRVFFYPGCAVEYFYPQMGHALVKILEDAGYEVDTPEKAACCGLPAIHAGDGESGKKTIQNNLKYMKNPDDYEAYLVLCPSCGMAIVEDFPEYTEGENRELSERISPKVKSLGMFMAEKGIKLNLPKDKKVTYHTPCHQGRGLGVSAEGILADLLGDAFVPMQDSDVCCGFGGSWSFDYAEISSGVLGKKLDNIEKTGADIVLADCPGCVIQINGGAQKNGMKQEVMHLSEFFKKSTE
ncbi:L-lactate dehydrogenase (quinone) large subunit LdhH [Limisalsivibrio acetivorans]|uniref:L-lactate dehydrogenase (quinone) large subunit LdhH n=1 Tax=Limisalsivibrio acetivorans TaxID=1304888 RepID=UPI001EE3260C|nr:LUD domain-containing protein [Limisalsivibrio acetivorans]